MVCLDLCLFDDQRTEKVAKIAAEGSLEVLKYDSETIEKMQG